MSGSNEDLGKLRKEYLNDLLCKFGPFCLQHSKTSDILRAFLRVTIAELSTLKQVRFLWLTLYIRFTSQIWSVSDHRKIQPSS